MTQPFPYALHILHNLSIPYRVENVVRCPLLLGLQFPSAPANTENGDG